MILLIRTETHFWKNVNFLKVDRILIFFTKGNIIWKIELFCLHAPWNLIFLLIIPQSLKHVYLIWNHRAACLLRLIKLLGLLVILRTIFCHWTIFLGIFSCYSYYAWIVFQFLKSSTKSLTFLKIFFY